jgi:hypothetical protein
MASDESQAQSAQNITVENDVFFGADRYYTNGIQFERRYRWANGQPRQAENSLLQKACVLFGCEGYPLYSRSHRGGQLMYTPTDITIGAPQPDDRPWAGLLYYAQDHTLMAPSADSLTKFTVQVGAMGSASLAEQSQKAIHKLINSDAPQGWANQARSELGVLLGVERKFALESLSGGTVDGWQWRSASSWRLAGGNIMTLAGAKLEITFGKGLPKLVEAPGDIPDKMVPPARQIAAVQTNAGQGLGNPLYEQPSKASTIDRSCLFSWMECQASVALEARLMAYNAFLDGPLFRDGPKVDSRPLVADASVAIQLRFPRTATRSSGPVFVQFKATRRSPEFRSSSSVKGQTFGALTIGCDFF